MMRSSFGSLAAVFLAVGCSSSDGGNPGGQPSPAANAQTGQGTQAPGVAQSTGAVQMPVSGAPTATAGQPAAGAPAAPPVTGGAQPSTGVQPGAGAQSQQPTAGADVGQPVDPAMMPGGAEGMSGTGAASSDCGEPGLQLEGLMYSPGGTLLPFPCEPFHPTNNNPYAVKCVDAWPWYDSGYAGDEFCILPPEPGKGIQIGVHPQGTDWYAQVSAGDLSGYKNPPDGFILAAGGEEERNYKTSSANTQSKNYYRNYVRMRAGSHHMIVSSVDGSASDQREFWAAGNALEGLFGGTSLPGAERPDANVPVSLDKPAEDKGLYRVLGANQTITYDMHHFNPTNEPALKETWTNLWFEDEDATIRVQPMFGMPFAQAAATFAQPGQTVDMHYSWRIGSDVRLIELYGHRHVWTSNFSAWVQKTDGSQEVLYQSFDWYDQPTFRYDSITTNPAPDSVARIDGGVSGVRVLKAGEQLHFNCHMTFTPERAAEEDAPMPSTIGPLRFANQAFRGEMCILFGSTAGTSLGQPADDGSPVPGFATAN